MTSKGFTEIEGEKNPQKFALLRVAVTALIR
jgi:hypothetical protein